MKPVLKCSLRVIKYVWMIFISIRLLILFINMFAHPLWLRDVRTDLHLIIYNLQICCCMYETWLFLSLMLNQCNTGLLLLRYFSKLCDLSKWLEEEPMRHMVWGRHFLLGVGFFCLLSLLLTSTQSCFVAKSVELAVHLMDNQTNVWYFTNKKEKQLKEMQNWKEIKSSVDSAVALLYWNGVRNEISL